MIPLFIVILGVLGFCGSMYLIAVPGKWFNYQAPDAPQIGGFLGACLSFILILVWTILWTTFWCSSYQDIQEMRAFQDTNIEWYLDTISQTANVEVQNTDGGIFIDIAYIEQSAITSERIVELRDRVNDYNEKLQELTAWNSSALDLMFADVPSDLKPIKLHVGE